MWLFDEKFFDNSVTILAGHGEILPPAWMIHMGDTQTSPQHADPHGFLVFFLAPSPCGSAFLFRKNLVSVKFFCFAILGPEMGAPILWAPGIFAFCRKPSISVKFLFLGGGGGIFGLLEGGRGECRFYFYGRGDFFGVLWSGLRAAMQITM